MSLTADEAEELALLEAEEADAKKRKTEAKQNAAFAGAEAEEILAGPTTKEKVAAGAMAARDTLLPSTDWKSLLASAAAPVTWPLTSSLAVARELGGADKKTEEAQEAAPGAYGAGQLAGTLAGLVGGGKTAQTVAPNAIKTAKAAAPTMGERAKAAAREIGRETLESGGEAKWRGNFARALKTLVGEGGDVAEKAIVGADNVAPVRPSWFAGLTDDVGAAADDLAPSGLDTVKRPPPVPKRAPRAPKNAEPKTAAPPDDLRAEAVERITVDDVGSAVPKAKPTGKSAQPEDGNAFLAREEARIQAEAEKAWRSLPPAPTPKPAGAPMSDAALRAEVKAAVARGEPLKALAKRLGVNQGEISTMFKAAQIGN